MLESLQFCAGHRLKPGLQTPGLPDGLNRTQKELHQALRDHPDTCAKYFKLCGICCSDHGDSSSMKYHFTLAFFAARRIAGRSIWPVPKAASLVTSVWPVSRPVGVPFFMSLRCINSQRLAYLSRSFTGSWPGWTIQKMSIS